MLLAAITALPNPTQLPSQEDLQSLISNQQQYIELIEQVNQQLSYTWTPIGTTIAALTVIVAVLTIIAAGFFFVQGREYKKSINQFKFSLSKESDTFIKQVKETFTELLSDQKLKLSTAETSYKDLFDKINREFEKLKTGKAMTAKQIEKWKKDIETDLDKLRQEKAKIDNFPTLSPNLGLSDGMFTGVPEYADPDPYSNTVKWTGTNMGRCQQCGKELTLLNQSQIFPKICTNCKPEWWNRATLN